MADTEMEKLLAEELTPADEAFVEKVTGPLRAKIREFMSEAAKDEVGWLIERYQDGMLIYWSGRDRNPTNAWTAKSDEAVRFSRHQDGAQVLAWLLNGNGRVVEHAWVNAPHALKEPRS